MNTTFASLLSTTGCTHSTPQGTSFTPQGTAYIRDTTRCADTAHIVLEKRVKRSLTVRDSGLRAAIEMFIIDHPSHSLAYFSRQMEMSARVDYVFDHMVKQLIDNGGVR